MRTTIPLKTPSPSCATARSDRRAVASRRDGAKKEVLKVSDEIKFRRFKAVCIFECGGRTAPQDQRADIVVPEPLAAAADGFEPGIEFRVFHGEPVHDLTLAS